MSFNRLRVASLCLVSAAGTSFGQLTVCTETDVKIYAIGQYDCVDSFAFAIAASVEKAPDDSFDACPWWWCGGGMGSTQFNCDPALASAPTEAYKWCVPGPRQETNTLSCVARGSSRTFQSSELLVHINGTVCQGAGFDQVWYRDILASYFSGYATVEIENVALSTVIFGVVTFKPAVQFGATGSLKRHVLNIGGSAPRVWWTCGTAFSLPPGFLPMPDGSYELLQELDSEDQVIAAEYFEFDTLRFDANDDGRFNQLDVDALPGLFAAPPDESFESQYDLNADGILDSSDILKIQSFVDDEIDSGYFGDINRDGVVDCNDVGAANWNVTVADGNLYQVEIDFNLDGIVDSIDFDVFRYYSADINQDGGVDGADIADFYTYWTNGDIVADYDMNGGVDGDDVPAFFSIWSSGC